MRSALVGMDAIADKLEAGDLAALDDDELKALERRLAELATEAARS